MLHYKKWSVSVILISEIGGGSKSPDQSTSSYRVVKQGRTQNKIWVFFPLVSVSAEPDPHYPTVFCWVYPQKVYSSISCLTTLWGEYQCCDAQLSGGLIYTQPHTYRQLQYSSAYKRQRLFFLTLNHSTHSVTFSYSASWITRSQHNGEIISSTGGGN